MAAPANVTTELYSFCGIAGKSRSGVQEFVALDLGGHTSLSILCGFGSNDLAVAADVDVAGSGDLLGKRDDEFNGAAQLEFSFGEKIKAAVADVAGEGFQLVGVRIERK